MRVVVNERFVRRRALWSRVATFAGLGALVLGFVISLYVEALRDVVDPTLTIAATWILMVGGVTAFNTGRFWDVRWVARPREDEVLVHYLAQPRKRSDGSTFYVGLDNNSYLLNYLPDLPQVLHLLVGPSGIFPLHVRRQEGEITNEGSKWRRKTSFRMALASLFEGSFGNPTLDARREAEAVRKLLAKQFDERELAKLPIQPLIVFMHPKVKLTLTQPEVPALTQQDLWPYYRKLRREQRLSPEQQEKVLAALGL